MADSRSDNEINEPVIGTGWQAVKWEHLFPGDNGKNKRDHGKKLYESGHVMFVTETKKASGFLILCYNIACILHGGQSTNPIQPPLCGLHQVMF